MAQSFLPHYDLLGLVVWWTHVKVVTCRSVVDGGGDISRWLVVDLVVVVVVVTWQLMKESDFKFF